MFIQINIEIKNVRTEDASWQNNCVAKECVEAVKEQIAAIEPEEFDVVGVDFTIS
jgi:hypothetical protein